jgi:tetratricopeptide (TPR) repeat protein
LDPTLLFAVLGIIVTAIVPFVGYIYKSRKESKNYYSIIWKDSLRIKSKEILGERPCEDYYLERNVDNFLQRSLERKRNALIIGPPLSGKTRAVFRAVKGQKKGIHILIPRNVNMQVFQLPRDFMFWKEKLIFIDDLQYYVERQDNYHLLFRDAKEKNIPVFAACHSGREYKKVRNKMIEQNLDPDIIFGEDVLEMEKLSTEEGKKVAEKLGMKWDNVKFNGTIGSIFMRLSEMERRFDSSDNIEKTILRVLKELYTCGIYEENSIFRLEWVKKASAKFELDGRDFEWGGWLKTLEDKEFIRLVRRNRIWAEDAYLEFVVKPEVESSQLEVLEEMAEVFGSDADVLQMIGERAYDIGTVDMQIGEYMKCAIRAFEHVIGLKGDSILPAEKMKAESYLGQSYWTLAKVQDTLENCRRSVEYFNEILKNVTLDSNPQEYAKIKNRIGNTYTAFAEVENREENCLIAIVAYNEALKVFTIEKNPLDYARACNNLGGAYIILADAKEPKKHYREAIEAFSEALKVRTASEYPKDYALTKNNIANTYAKLSEIEQPEMNLLMAIESYKDVLKINTKEKFPLQYGAVMNNIGNAYSLLAAVKDKKSNCDKAIEAFERSLEVRNIEQVPVQYANTMFNLADMYLLLSSESDDPEVLDKALNAFEESLRVRTKQSYPNQYAEVKFGMGRAYIKLAEFEERALNYEKAIDCFEEALEFFTEEEYPNINALIMKEISSAKKVFFR